MSLRDKIVSYGGAALIFGAVTFGGGQIASHFKTFKPEYWRGEVVEEKQKRLEVLDKISGFGEDGKYSVQEIADLHEGLMYAIMSFNYMDCDKGDLKADESPFSPGDALMGDMNVRYRKQFPKYYVVMVELSDKYLEMEGVPKEKIPEVKRHAGRIRNKKRSYEVLQDEIRKYKSRAGVYGQSLSLDLSQSDLDEKVNSAIAGVKSILTDPKLQGEDFKDADFRTKSYKYMVGGLGGIVVGVVGFLGLSSLYKQKES